MPAYVVERVADALNERGKSLKGAKILLLGVAYKRDLDDDRESPSFKLIELLQRKHAQVSYHDPFVPTLTPGADTTIASGPSPRRPKRRGRRRSSSPPTTPPSITTSWSGMPNWWWTRNATRNVRLGREKIVLA